MLHELNMKWASNICWFTAMYEWYLKTAIFVFMHGACSSTADKYFSYSIWQNYLLNRLKQHFWLWKRFETTHESNDMIYRAGSYLFVLLFCSIIQFNRFNSIHTFWSFWCIHNRKVMWDFQWSHTDICTGIAMQLFNNLV